VVKRDTRWRVTEFPKITSRNSRLAQGIVMKIKKTVFYYVGFDVFTAVNMKNAVFWDVAPVGSCKNRRF
jgi:hypothetical protein